MSVLLPKPFHCSYGCMFGEVLLLRVKPPPQSQVFCCRKVCVFFVCSLGLPCVYAPIMLFCGSDLLLGIAKNLSFVSLNGAPSFTFAVSLQENVSLCCTGFHCVSKEDLIQIQDTLFTLSVKYCVCHKILINYISVSSCTMI